MFSVITTMQSKLDKQSAEAPIFREVFSHSFLPHTNEILKT